MGDFIIYSMICVVIMLFPPLGILLLWLTDICKNRAHRNLTGNSHTTSVKSKLKNV